MVKNDIIKNNYNDDEISDQTLIYFISIIPNFINNNYVKNRLNLIIINQLFYTYAIFNYNIAINQITKR